MWNIYLSPGEIYICSKCEIYICPQVKLYICSKCEIYICPQVKHILLNSRHLKFIEIMMTTMAFVMCVVRSCRKLSFEAKVIVVMNVWKCYKVNFLTGEGMKVKVKSKHFSFETSVQSILVLKHLSTLHLHYPPFVFVFVFVF